MNDTPNEPIDGANQLTPRTDNSLTGHEDNCEQLLDCSRQLEQELAELEADLQFLAERVGETNTEASAEREHNANVVDQLRAKVAALELQTFDIKALEADKARLDWLSTQPQHSMIWSWKNNTVRSAIDAAIKEDSK